MDDRCFAGPVRADDADDLTRIDLEGDAIDGFERFEKLGDRFDFADKLGHPP